jgi:hypothetical protein
VLVRMVIFHSSFTWKHWVGLVFTSAAYAIPYIQLAKMAQPDYADDGDLLDGGFDMSTAGVCGYVYSPYVCSLLQCLCVCMSPCVMTSILNLKEVGFP